MPRHERAGSTMPFEIHHSRNAVRHVLDEYSLSINRVMALFGTGSDVLGLLHLFRCPVDDKHVFVGLQGDIVLQYAVLGDAETNQARTNCAYASKDNCAFETSYNPGNDWTGCKNRSEAWYEEETPSPSNWAATASVSIPAI